MSLELSFKNMAKVSSTLKFLDSFTGALVTFVSIAASLFTLPPFSSSLKFIV